MDDPKNIEKLLSSMDELELPQGYDARFSRKLEEQNDSSWMRKFLLLPTNLGWAAALGSFLVVSLKLIEKRKQSEIDEVAVRDEIDMLDDLDVLMEWDEEVQS